MSRSLPVAILFGICASAFIILGSMVFVPRISSDAGTIDTAFYMINFIALAAVFTAIRWKTKWLG